MTLMTLPDGAALAAWGCFADGPEDPEAWVSLGRIRGAAPSGGRNRAQPKVSSARS